MLQNVRQQESPSSACGALPWIQTHCQILCVGRCLQFVLQVLPHTQGKRLIEHLKDVPTCVQVYQQSLPALPDDMVQALEDHAHTRTHTHTHTAHAGRGVVGHKSIAAGSQDPGTISSASGDTRRTTNARQMDNPHATSRLCLLETMTGQASPTSCSSRTTFRTLSSSRSRA